MDLGQPSGILYEAFTELERQPNKGMKIRGRGLGLHVRFVPARREDFAADLIAGLADIGAGAVSPATR